MCDAAALLAELEAAGLLFTLDGGRLAVAARAAPVTAEQRQRIAGTWHDLTALVRRRQDDETAFERRLVLPPGGHGWVAWLCDWED